MEFMLSAARSTQAALRVIDCIQVANELDTDLMADLKRYVEDTSEAIKKVDDKLKEVGTSLAALLFELPDKTSANEASWRNLIGRRIILAHKLLTIDDSQVYGEAIRDFGPLNELISSVNFVPVKTDLASGRGFSPMIRAHTLRALSPSAPGETPTIGSSLIFIPEDKQKGFVALRYRRASTVWREVGM